MIARFWNGESKTITSAALIMGGAALLSRLLGMIRDRVLAGTFGAGDTLDAYYAAFRLPDFLYGLLVFGALSAGFVPVFTEHLLKKNGERDAWRLVNEVLGVLAIALSIGTVLLIILAPLLVPLVAPGYRGPKLELTVLLSRIMFLSPLLLGFSAVLGGVLQSTKRFFAFAVAPLFYNIGIIVGAVVFYRSWGPVGLAIGVAFGSSLHLLSQYLPVARLGFRIAPVARRAGDGVAEIMRLSLPRIASLAVFQVDLTVATIVASTLAVGSVTVLNLANNLQMVPVAFIGISYAVASFPALSRLAAKREKDEFIRSVSGVTREILFFVVPFSIVFMLLRAQIVRVVLGSGSFDWSDTIRTADTLAFFALSMAAQAVVPLLMRAFFALKDSTTPMLIALVTVGVDVIGMLTLPGLRTASGTLGVSGLALAFTFASFVQVSLLYVTLRVRLGALSDEHLIRSLMKIATAAVPMGLVIQLVKNFLGTRLDLQSFLGIFLQGAIAGLLGLAVYLAVALLLRSEEALSFAATMRRRVRVQQLPVVAADEAVEKT